jgi:hypothetical protein
VRVFAKRVSPPACGPSHSHPAPTPEPYLACGFMACMDRPSAHMTLPRTRPQAAPASSASTSRASWWSRATKWVARRKDPLAQAHLTASFRRLHACSCMCRPANVHPRPSCGVRGAERALSCRSGRPCRARCSHARAQVTLFTRGKKKIAYEIPDDTPGSFATYSKAIKHIQGDRMVRAACRIHTCNCNDLLAHTHITTSGPWRHSMMKPSGANGPRLVLRSQDFPEVERKLAREGFQGEGWVRASRVEDSWRLAASRLY